jgi:hypothetical protein
VFCFRRINHMALKPFELLLCLHIAVHHIANSFLIQQFNTVLSPSWWMPGPQVRIGNCGPNRPLGTHPNLLSFKLSTLLPLFFIFVRLDMLPNFGL